MSVADLQLFRDWVRAARAAANNVTTSHTDDPIVCVRCGESILLSIQIEGDVICRRCGVLFNDGRGVSADDGLQHAQHKREYDLLDELQLGGTDAPCITDLNRYHQRRRDSQSYQRAYHFNERMASRNNRDPRIPIDALWAIAAVLHALLPGELASKPQSYTKELIESVCRELHRPAFAPYAERWIQIRYYMITGETERQRVLPADTKWDLPWIKDSEVLAMRHLFKELAQCFDELFYKRSRRRTTKDNYTFESDHPDARHNILNLNFITQAMILMLFGKARFDELRTDFCFPLMPTKRRAPLNRMMHEIVQLYNEKCGVEMIRFEDL